MTFTAEINIVNVVLTGLVGIIAYFLNRYFKTQDAMNTALFKGLKDISESFSSAKVEIGEIGQWTKSHEKQDDERFASTEKHLDRIEKIQGFK